ncbi:Molybdenum cofactor biosynthesis prote [Pleurostoma richardsiae]|uniref:Molybdenum cofactor biosynthesis prote n=1 Tax=Pleurostoma richardsiae TaxID=41990 RepID=A0AA38VV24_9PEZI|nr:Molybdenum cofactor biosynthesis prote [Pleurostoma richardsiae]
MALPWTSRTVPRLLRRGCRDSASTRPWRGVATTGLAEERPSWSSAEDDVAAASASRPSRRDAIRNAKPFSHFLTDTFSRQHDYLRISLTEKCNLRCLYCMPEEGVPLYPPRELLTTPEIVLLSSVFVSQGVTKIRLTGGEPTVRRDILPLMQQIGALRPHGLRELCLTTNGLALHRKLEPMVEAGLTGVNLSLDTLDPWQFQIMTRRKGFEAVQKSIQRIFELNKAGAGIKFKINCVVMRGINDREIIPFVEMTRDRDVEVRFIEYMPFDGNKWSEGKMLSYQEMLDVIRGRYPELQKVQGHRNDTSKTWHIPGFAGKIGFITSMTHNFCGTCNRLRITSDGNLKVCLFGNAEVSLRDVLRKANGGEPIDEAAYEEMRKLAIDRAQGLAASGKPLTLAPNSEELLEIIGVAVKGKKEKHAGIGELEHMKNRPMILIDSRSLVHQNTSGIQWTRTGLASPPSPRNLPLSSPYGPAVFQSARLFSSLSRPLRAPGGDRSSGSPDPPEKLTHLSPSGTAHMVSISEKSPTARTARAACSVVFSSPLPLRLIRENAVKKGDVLGVARVAGIMAAKRTPDLIPLCHPVAITHVSVDLEPVGGSSSSEEGEGDWRVDIAATVSCEGKTGVEMEALTAAGAAALTVYDMCKAVDKGMRVEGLRVVLKEGGKSGRWVEGMKAD